MKQARSLGECIDGRHTKAGFLSMIMNEWFEDIPVQCVMF
jgi:hypothetical protein